MTTRMMHRGLLDMLSARVGVTYFGHVRCEGLANWLLRTTDWTSRAEAAWQQHIPPVVLHDDAGTPDAM